MVKRSTRLDQWFRRLLPGFWCCFLVLVLSFRPGSEPGMAQGQTVQLPLSTRGSQIVDAVGYPVLLRGVNWFGLETETQVPHGLWQRDYQEMISQIRDLGYNVIRLPYSVQALRGDSINSVDFSIGSNRNLQGKTPLEAMDLIVQEAARQGVMILLDSHRLNNQRIPELWYGDGFTEEDWITTWTMLATRYRNQPNVIGADLKNEPHGQASWGTGDRNTDWRLAAERAGNAILRINPNWLIVVEGVEKNVPGQRLPGHWWGGNLEGVRRFPVRLSNRRKLVYSPHEYGPGVVNQPWFADANFPRSLLNRWEIGFHYIATQGIAPIWVGEFGGRQVDRESKEGIWQRQFVRFLNQNNLGFAYWSWNPNSRDTGGILQDDWQTIDAPKQTLLNRLLPAPGLERDRSTPSPTPSPSHSVPELVEGSTPPPSHSVPELVEGSTHPPSHSVPELVEGSTPPPRLDLRSTIHSNWATGFCVGMQVTSRSETPIRNWRLTFQMNQATINNSWNGTFDRQGIRYTVTPPDWARSLSPGQTLDLGFCASKQGPDYQPQQIRVVN